MVKAHLILVHTNVEYIDNIQVLIFLPAVPVRVHIYIYFMFYKKCINKCSIIKKVPSPIISSRVYRKQGK